MSIEEVRAGGEDARHELEIADAWLGRVNYNQSLLGERLGNVASQLADIIQELRGIADTTDSECVAGMLAAHIAIGAAAEKFDAVTTGSQSDAAVDAKVALMIATERTKEAGIPPRRHSEGIRGIAAGLEQKQQIIEILGGLFVGHQAVPTTQIYDSMMAADEVIKTWQQGL